MTAPDNKHGKKFEQEFSRMVKKMAEIHPIYVHRFVDTYSARGLYLPPQPADYLILINGSPALFELKSSTRHHSLSEKGAISDLFNPQQIAQARLWTRAGGSAFVVFWAADEGHNQVEWWAYKAIIYSFLNHEMPSKDLCWSMPAEKMEEVFTRVINSGVPQ